MWQYWQYLLIALLCLLSTQCQALVSPATGWQQKPLSCPHSCPRQLKSPLKSARSGLRCDSHFSQPIDCSQWWNGHSCCRSSELHDNGLLHNVILVIVCRKSAPAISQYHFLIFAAEDIRFASNASFFVLAVFIFGLFIQNPICHDRLAIFASLIDVKTVLSCSGKATAAIHDFA